MPVRGDSPPGRQPSRVLALLACEAQAERAPPTEPALPSGTRCLLAAVRTRPPSLKLTYLGSVFGALILAAVTLPP